MKQDLRTDAMEIATIFAQRFIDGGTSETRSKIILNLAGWMQDALRYRYIINTGNAEKEITIAEQDLPESMPETLCQWLGCES